MPRGVCVFDLDHTLTCGDPARAVAACRDAGYALAVNTARPSAWLEPGLRALGLPAPGTPAFRHNPRSYQQTEHQRAEHKGRAMHGIARHFGTPNLVLFDDLDANVDAARRHGYRGRRVGGGGACGVSEDDLRHALGDAASHDVTTICDIWGVRGLRADAV